MSGDAPSGGASSSWVKRFRIKAYTNAFLVEVNLAHYQDPLGDLYNVNKVPSNESTDKLTKEGGPALIIFRDRMDMVELVHSSHLAHSELKEHLGQLECVLQVHAILGVMPIKGRRFLIVVSGHELVGSIPPDCSPLGVWHKSDDTIERVLSRCSIYPRQRNIFVITNVIGLPFHVPTDIFLSSKLLKTVYTAESQSGVPIPPTEIDLTVEDLLGSSIANVVTEVERMLSKGIHFFSFDCDLTRSLQNQYELYVTDGILALPQKVPCWTNTDKSADLGDGKLLRAPSLMSYAEPCFVWNSALSACFQQNSVDQQWTCPVIQGSVSATKVNMGDHFANMLLISRRSSFRGGTRYFARGLDEQGNTANFCESEMLASIYAVTTGDGNAQVPYFPSTSLYESWGGWWSYRQIRGSAACYWDQLGFSLNPQPRINGSEVQNMEAFERHEKALEQKYGKIHYIDLLSTTKVGEARISQYVRDLMAKNEDRQKSAGVDLIGMSASLAPTVSGCSYKYSDWDFHRAVQIFGFEDSLRQFGGREDILRSLATYGWFRCRGPELQTGVFRTNCLDCLDRTTVIQWYLCERAFLLYLLEHEELRALVNLQGVKYTQEAYNWILKRLRPRKLSSLISTTDEEESDAVTQQFTRDCEPLPLQLPHHSKKPFQYPCARWRSTEPLLPFPPFSATSVLPRFSFAPNWSGDESAQSGYLEARIYFVGGWTNDRLLTVFFKCPVKYLENKRRFELNATRIEIACSKNFVKTWWSGQEYNNLQTLASGKDLPAIVPMALPVEESDQTEQSAITHVMKDGISSMWADAGDLISVAYTGTASVLTPLLKSGRATILTNLTHLKRSVGRLYKHTFEDKAKQEAIDALVGTSYAAVVPSMAAPSSTKLPLTSGDASVASTAALCNVWVGTWNTGGGASLPREDLSDWLQKGLEENVELFLVAFQEIVELASISTVLNTRNKGRENEAVGALMRIARIAESYQVVSTKTLVGVTSIVLARHDVASQLDDVDCYVIKMGILGQVVGNKGAVVTHFTFKGRNFSFCNVHFNPDKNSDRTQERLNQFEKLFSTPPSSASVNGSVEGCNRTIREHDYWFVAGDFNCPAMASVAEIEKWLAERKFAEFFQRDQLSWLRNLASATCMQDVSEATVSFWPTYKYKKGTSTYDRKRAPSWCDRVLFGGVRLNKGLASVQTLRYDRVKTIVSSDHRPVYFLCSIYEPAEELL